MKRFVLLIGIILFIGIMLMGGACSKQNTKPEEFIRWENVSNDTVMVSIETKGIIALLPHQVRIVGDESYINLTFWVDGVSNLVERDNVIK